MEIYDVVIVGAGAAGLTASIYLKRANKKILLLDKGAPGGKLLTVSEISNYPGYPSISGSELAIAFYTNAQKQGVEVEYGEVTSIRKEGTKFFLSLMDKREICSLSVVIATGLYNPIYLKGEKDLLGRGVSHCATCDGPLYRGKKVLLEATHEKGIEEANYLLALVDELYFVTPEEKEEYPQELLAKENLKFFEKSKVLEVGGKEKVESALVETTNGKEEFFIDAIFPLLHERSAAYFLEPLGVLNPQGFVKTNAELMSDIPGLFAIGDARDTPMRQVVTAASDGALVSRFLLSYLRKNSSK